MTDVMIFGTIVGPFDATFIDMYFSCQKIRQMLLPLSYLIFLVGWCLYFSRKQRDITETIRFIIFASMVMLVMSNWWNIIRPLTDALADICPSMKDNLMVQFSKFSTYTEGENSKLQESQFSLWNPLTWMPYLVCQFLYMMMKVMAWWTKFLCLGIGLIKWGALFILWAVSPLIFPMMLIDELRQNVVKFILSNLAIALWPLAAFFIDLIILGLMKMMIHIYTIGSMTQDDTSFGNSAWDFAQMFAQNSTGILSMILLLSAMTSFLLLNTFLYMTIPKVAHELVTGGNIGSVLSQAMTSAASAAIDAAGKVAGAALTAAGMPVAAAAAGGLGSAAAGTLNQSGRP